MNQHKSSFLIWHDCQYALFSLQIHVCMHIDECMHEDNCTKVDIYENNVFLLFISSQVKTCFHMYLCNVLKKSWVCNTLFFLGGGSKLD